MKRIKENSTYELEIKKSKFITKLYFIESIEEIKEYLEEIRKDYKDATHYCYAYILNDKKKSSDDGEPGGTAGVPMMEILNKHNLNFILCIVIRYFGGIKLGVGGLVRAYSKCVREAILNTEVIELEKGYIIEIETDYSNENRLIQLIGKENILEKSYDEKLKVTAKIKEINLNKLESVLHKIKNEIWL